MAARRGFAGRDQEISSFGPILARLCDAADLEGAVLVDGEGEAVDYAGLLPPFDLKVMAAEWRNVFHQLSASQLPGASHALELTVRASGKSFAVFTLTDGYAMVVQLPKHSFVVSRRAVGEALRSASDEAGLPHPAGWDLDQWEAVEVRETKDRLRRPVALWLRGAWSNVELLGSYHQDRGATVRERGYRVRLADGSEFTLVRERLGRWFADMAPSRRR